MCQGASKEHPRSAQLDVGVAVARWLVPRPVSGRPKVARRGPEPGGRAQGLSRMEQHEGAEGD